MGKDGAKMRPKKFKGFHKDFLGLSRRDSKKGYSSKFKKDPQEF